MPRSRCTVCRRTEIEKINKDLRDKKQTVNGVGKRYGVKYTTLLRHRDKCLGLVSLSKEGGETVVAKIPVEALVHKLKSPPPNFTEVDSEHVKANIPVPEPAPTEALAFHIDKVYQYATEQVVKFKDRQDVDGANLHLRWFKHVVDSLGLVMKAHEILSKRDESYTNINNVLRKVNKALAPYVRARKAVSAALYKKNFNKKKGGS